MDNFDEFKNARTIEDRVNFAINELNNLVAQDFDKLGMFTIKRELLFIAAVLKGTFLN